jgi:hypothetical protein
MEIRDWPLDIEPLTITMLAFTPAASGFDGSSQEPVRVTRNAAGFPQSSLAYPQAWKM